MEREQSNALEQRLELAADGRAAGKDGESAQAGAADAGAMADAATVPAAAEQSAPPPVHPRLAGRAQPSGPDAEVPEPDAIRPDSSPEWQELFWQVRKAVDRLRE